MGYFVPASADDRLAGPYADYSTALAALRADSSASDGDVYVLNSGDVYVAQSIGSSFGLIPSAWADQIQEDMSNATGSALRIAGETLLTTLGRGWTEFNNVGTITESGDALRFDSSTTNNGYAQLHFSPTSGLSSSTGFLVGIVIQIVDAPSQQGGSSIHFRDGTKERRIHLDDNATAGALHWASNASTDKGSSNASIGTNKSAVFIYFPASGESGRVEIAGDPRSHCIVDYSDFANEATTLFFINAYNTGGGVARQVVFDVFDIAVWEVTP